MSIKYTKKMFIEDVLPILGEDYDPVFFAKCVNNIFFKQQGYIALELRDLMLDLMLMEDGPEFEMTRNEVLSALGC